MAAPRRPDPEPLATNDLRVVVIGTVLWAVALVVSLVLGDRLSGGGHSWVWVSAAGVVLGLVGIRHLRRRRPVTDNAGNPTEHRSAPKKA